LYLLTTAVEIGF